MSVRERWTVVALLFAFTYLAGRRFFIGVLRELDPARRALGRGEVYDAFLAARGRLIVAAGVVAAIADGARAGAPRFHPSARDAAAVAFGVWCALIVWVDLWLGRAFRAPGGPTLITAGPYTWIRHPRYLCWLGLLVSVAIVADSPLGVALVGGFLLLVLRRIDREERYLRAHEPRYGAYAARTRRLVPWIY